MSVERIKQVFIGGEILLLFIKLCELKLALRSELLMIIFIHQYQNNW